MITRREIIRSHDSADLANIFSLEILLMMFSNDARSQSKHCKVVSVQSLGCTSEMEVPDAIVSTTTHTRSYTVEDIQCVLTAQEMQEELY